MQEHDLKRRLKHRPTETSIKAVSVAHQVMLKLGDLELTVKVTEVEDDEESLWGEVCKITDPTQPPPHPDELMTYHDGTPNVGEQIHFWVYHVWEVSE